LAAIKKYKMTNIKLASVIVDLLGKSMKQPNELGRFITDFTNATINWIRPLFLIEEKENQDFKDFKENPNDDDNKDVVKARIKKALNNNEEMKTEFLKLITEISKDKSKTGAIINNVLGEKNTFIQGGSGNTVNINN
jgi:hypothetical protein